MYKLYQPRFKCGDKVQLNSGGPEMIIDGIIQKGCYPLFGPYRVGDIVCKWSDYSGTVFACFNSDMLKPYK